MKKDLKFILFFGFIMVSYSAFSQGNSSDMSGETVSQTNDRVDELKSKPLNGFFGMTFSNSVPQGIYMNNIGNAGPGLGLYGGWRFDPFPVTLGVEADLHFFHSSERTYKYLLSNGWTYARDTLHTSSYNVPITVFARFEPNILHYVFPYIEGIGGINMMSTSATYNSYWGVEDNKDEFNVNFIYGVGAGIMFKLADFVQLPNKNTRFLLDLSFRYMFGTCSDYYTVKENQDASVSFTKFQSETEQIMFNAGFVVHF